MKKQVKRDLYYTNDHEWIDFQGSVAYVGVCNFKLLGFKEVHQITFSDLLEFKKKGEVIATIKYNDYQIEAHMPADGKVIQINDALTPENSSLLLQQAESNGWIALIVLSQPYERKELLLPNEYQLNRKNKYAK